MRNRPVDHSLWLAIDHAAQVSGSLFMGFTDSSQGKRESTALDLVARALRAGANPDAEFSLPGRKQGMLTLTCMERAFGQLHAKLLVPIVELAVAGGWSADSVPAGLWGAGMRAPESHASPPDPSPWILPSAHLEKQPGWLQLVAQGRPWGDGEASAKLCRLLVRAGAPLLRPAQALIDGPDEEEGSFAYRELPDPVRLAVSRAGNLNVAIALVEDGALESWQSVDSLRHLAQEVDFGWGSHPQANSLISLVKARAEAVALDQQTPRPTGSLAHSRRSL